MTKKKQFSDANYLLFINDDNVDDGEGLITSSTEVRYIGKFKTMEEMLERAKTFVKNTIDYNNTNIEDIEIEFLNIAEDRWYSCDIIMGDIDFKIN